MTSQSGLDGPRLLPAPGENIQQLVVLLHGYGADGSDLIDLGRFWQALLPGVAFVAPDAPEPLPFDGFGGRQWFALDERTPAEYRFGAEAAQPVLDRFLDEELEKLSLDDRSLAIFGFSQGAMMALQAGLRRKTPPAGILAYSGLLPGADRLGQINRESPVLIVHGANDDLVPSYHGQAAQVALDAAGVQSTFHELDGLAHSIDDRGVSLGGRFLQTVFSGEK
ncbi:alpha/beta fold hydrolase [uncultured Roseibium sp.]|uniref:alpha/beta hydrolase n=1 Tax=uncultured Roseibium sp. TaxID=1936171 RepID=UPI00262D0C4E|nr:alpha/beta fold hydrolase [uncultured Roseibium sp.]